jgi:hypothetical protein
VISLAAIKGAIQTVVTVYRVGVIGYELVRAELAQRPKPAPLTYRDVRHIQSQIASSTSFTVSPKK